MPLPRPTIPVALLMSGLALLTSGCATDAKAQLDAGTNAAISSSVRALPAVTGATTTETTTPVDTVTISLATALDRNSPQDLTSAAELLREAATMVYAVRHNTVAAVAVSVYGFDSMAANSRPTSLLAQRSFAPSELAASSS